MTFTSSQKCYICGCSPKHANDIDKVLKLSTKPKHFKFSLSTLHAWIRLFECLLHVISFGLQNLVDNNYYK